MSVWLRLTKLSQPVKGWKGRTGGELVWSFSTGSPPCDWVPHYQQSPKPFQPQATSSSTLVAGPPQGPVGPAGPREDSPAAAAIGTPVRRGSPISHQASDEGETSPDTSIPDRTSRRRRARRGNRSRYSSSDSDDSHASTVRRRKKDGFSNKIQIPEFGGWPVRCELTRRRPVGAIDVTNRVICKKTARSLRKKTVEGPSHRRGLFQPNQRRRRPS